MASGTKIVARWGVALALASGGLGAQSSVSFERDIAPLFAKHCYGCHGSDDPEGGLRLDLRTHALRGGDSGGVILGGDLATNELWRRVSSSDDDYRMPLGGRLDARDLDLVRRWIADGSPWPDPASDAAPSEGPDPLSLGFSAREAAQGVVDRVGWILALVLVIVLVGERLRRRDPGLRRHVAVRLAAGIRPIHGAVCALVLCLASTVLDQTEWRRQAATQLAPISRTTPDEVRRIVFGTPPVPHRIDSGSSLHRLYYRGNCERSDTLFNGGVYRTSTLHLSLHDRERRPLEVGDPPPDDGLLVHLEIVRAPNTAPTMFSKRKLASVFLSERWYEGRVEALKEEPVVLETDVAGARWSAWFPVRWKPGQERCRGRAYLYLNRRSDGRPFKPTVHYGIDWDLVIDDGRIAAGSDLWLGNLFWNARLEIPQPEGRVPLREWLDVNPLPEIPDGHPYHDARRHLQDPDTPRRIAEEGR